MWIKATMLHLRYHPDIYLEEPTKATKATKKLRIVGVSVEIRTGTP
jgi:hypothetical protein